MVQKNDSYEILSIFSVAIYHMHAGMNLFMIVHEKQITENLAHLLVNKNEIFKKKKWISLVVALFALRFPMIFNFNVQKINII